MTDFVVIGGGIAGVSAGARLASLGRVTLIEAETALGYHASGRSAALYEASYGLPATVALNVASGDYMHGANGGYLSPRGMLLVAGKDHAESFAGDIVTLSLEEISVDAACGMVPILNPGAVAFAGYHEAAWDIDTDRLLQDFARAIRANGEIVTGARVDHITRGGAGWVVSAGEQSFEGRVLVNAAGAWADQVAAMAGIAPIGIVPHRRSMARMPAPGGHDLRLWPMLMGSGESWYAKPDAGKWIVSPAEEHPMEPHDAWADDMVLAEGLARYEAMVSEPVTRVETTWAGLRSFSPDRALVLGPDPEHPDFVWCAGQGGYGFQTSPAASQLLADLVAGHTPEIDAGMVARLVPARFRQ
ncbi:MAG: NAD(P)/FAD-dependent oxidoreductase [Gemmobacter sp.]